MGNQWPKLNASRTIVAHTGTGGVAGKPLTPAEEQVLQVTNDRELDLVDGIRGEISA